MLAPERERPCDDKLAQLTTALNQIMLLLEEIVMPVCRELSLAISVPRFSNMPTQMVTGPAPARTPITDRTTFSVRWDGKTCYLGNTLPFRLLERLARRPNQHVSYEQLCEDVWEATRSKEAVRSAVKALRQKLAAADMDELKAAISGSTRGHYCLMLDPNF